MRRCRAIAVLMLLLCLHLFSACTPQTELPEESVIAYEDMAEQNHEYFEQFYTQGHFIRDGVVDLNIYNEEAPRLTIQNAQGQVLVLEEAAVRGTMKLYYANHTQIWNYDFPSSESYCITLTEPREIEPFCCVMSGAFQSSDVNQFFAATTSGATQLQYSCEKAQLFGENMDYSLSLSADPTDKGNGLSFLGTGESCLTVKRDGADFLIRGAQAPCKVLFDGKLDGEFYLDLDLGDAPAGKWSRLHLEDAQWSLTPEPAPLRPWAAGLAVALLAAGAVLLLVRRRKRPHDLGENTPDI